MIWKRSSPSCRRASTTRSPQPKSRYDAVIVGGGGHGLATAYYLAKEHGMANIAVLEKGWLGGGNTGRNTTIVRSNYHLDPNAHFYEFSLKLWERLAQELNFNIMYSARGVLNLVHSPNDMDAAIRRGNAMRIPYTGNPYLSAIPARRASLPNIDPRFKAAPKDNVAARDTDTASINLEHRQGAIC